MDGSPNLIGTWVQEGTSGSISVDATTKTLSVTPAGDGTVQTTARQSFALSSGKRYWLTYELQTSTQMWRTIGTTPGGTSILGANVSTVNETKIDFTPTSTPVWMDFFRKALGTPRIGNIRLEEVPPGSATGRRLNGRNQCFLIDAQAAGLRTANDTQYIGGWFKFQYVPTSVAYLFDGAVPGVGTSGAERIRIFYDPAAPKIAASTGATSVYLERYFNGAVAADVWHYVGVIVKADRSIDLVYDGSTGGSTMGSQNPAAANYLQTLMFGARTSSPTNSFSPVILSDWVWCAGTLPTTEQITALSSGYRPPDIEGFEPTYYWPMNETGATEPSVTGTAVLTAQVSSTTILKPYPPTTVGPYYLQPVTEEIPPLMFF